MPWDALPEAAKSPERGAGDGAGGNSQLQLGFSIPEKKFRTGKNLSSGMLTQKVILQGASLYHVALK